MCSNPSRSGEIRNSGILLPLAQNCICGRFLRRVKRFSIEFEYMGQKLWAHTNNSGGMLGLLRRGAPVLVSPAGRAGRKLPYTLERIWVQHGFTPYGFWAGVNTSAASAMLEAAFHAGILDFCHGYSVIRREVKYGESRLDACISDAGKPALWVECKHVTLVEDGVAAFPDAVSLRAQKHLHELMGVVASGERGAMFYLAARPDGSCFSPADYIDRAYADLFYEAMAKGVEAYVYQAVMHPQGMSLGRRIPIKTG